MKRFVSTGFMVIYWIALPLSALLALGLGWIVLTPGASQYQDAVMPLWGSFLASIVLTLMIVWRLWTHGRARRHANERASTTEASRNDND